MSADTYFVEFGARLKQAREAAGITQAQLAKQVRVTRSSVANIEAGRQKPPVGTAARCAQVLHCDPGWLLAGDDAEVRRRGLENLRAQLVSVLRHLDVAGVESSGLLPEFVAEGLGRSAAGIDGVIKFIDRSLPPSSSIDEGSQTDG